MMEFLNLVIHFNINKHVLMMCMHVMYACVNVRVNVCMNVCENAHAHRILTLFYLFLFYFKISSHL